MRLFEGRTIYNGKKDLNTQDYMIAYLHCRDIAMNPPGRVTARQSLMQLYFPSLHHLTSVILWMKTSDVNIDPVHRIGSKSSKQPSPSSSLKSDSISLVPSSSFSSMAGGEDSNGCSRRGKKAQKIIASIRATCFQLTKLRCIVCAWSVFAHHWEGEELMRKDGEV